MSPLHMRSRACPGPMPEAGFGGGACGGLGASCAVTVLPSNNAHEAKAKNRSCMKPLQGAGSRIRRLLILQTTNGTHETTRRNWVFAAAVTGDGEARIS